jgi:hypothetical protein
MAPETENSPESGEEIAVEPAEAVKAADEEAGTDADESAPAEVEEPEVDAGPVHVLAMASAFAATLIVLAIVVVTGAWDAYRCDTNDDCRGLKACFAHRCYSPEMWEIEHGSVAIDLGSDRTLAGTATGTQAATELVADCTGWVGGPYHEFILSTLAGERLLEVSLLADDDATLVVSHADESWCANGADPMLTLDWHPGTYTISVGGSAQDEALEYSINFSDEAPPAPAPTTTATATATEEGTGETAEPED